jgi:hypothetical protein
MSKLRQLHLLTRLLAVGGAHRGRPANGEDESPPAGTLMRAGRGRRLASLSVAAAAGVVLGTAALTPAMASTIAETSTGANIVQRAYNGDLMFYSAASGSTTWTPEIVDGTRTTDSVPAIAETSAGANITAVADNGSLMFYWAASGSTTWHPETVAGPGTTSFYVGPSIAETSTGVDIAADGPGNTLMLYSAANGSGTWTAQTVAGPGSSFPADLTYSDPSIAVTSTGVDIAAEGPNNTLRFYWAANGSTTWHAQTVATGIYSDPAIAVTSSGVNITAEGPNNSLMFYWAANGGVWPVWHAETVAGPGTISYFGPSIAETSTGVDITAEGPSNALMLYSAANGSGTFTAQTVAGPGTNYEPSIAVTSTGVNITAGGGYNPLMFYWAANGGVWPVWHAEQVAPGGILG